ncbi:MAG: hypothetical protein ABFD97_02840 [Syntrophobacter sp.]
MRMPMTAEDIIVGIFYHLRQADCEKVTADREILHRAFFKAKVDFPQVMKMFSFRQRELFPESVQLDQALSNLDATGLISRQNVTPRYYRFEQPLTTSYKRFSEKILDKAGIAEEDIRRVANEIQRLTSSNPQ